MTTTSTGNGNWTSVVGSLTINDDVVINHDVDLDGVVNMDGTLTINASKTLDTTASNHNLTVGSGNLSASDGHISVSGVLNCRSSTVDVGSIKIESGGTMTAPNATMTIRSESGTGYALENAGTFHHSSNVIHITGPTDSHATIKGFTSSHPLNNLYINNAGAGMKTYIEGDIEIEGYLLVPEIRQALTAIVGFYFGQATVKR